MKMLNCYFVPFNVKHTHSKKTVQGDGTGLSKPGQPATDDTICYARAPLIRWLCTLGQESQTVLEVTLQISRDNIVNWSMNFLTHHTLCHVSLSVCVSLCSSLIFAIDPPQPHQIATLILSPPSVLPQHIHSFTRLCPCSCRRRRAAGTRRGLIKCLFWDVVRTRMWRRKPLSNNY